MSRVLITESSDGLGLVAARLLVADGHSVTLHAWTDDTRADLLVNRSRDRPHPTTRDVTVQVRPLRYCAELTDVELPR